jgi:hypothetical protein
MLRLSSILTSPAIVMIVLGVLLFILGFCGCLGALLEVFFLLIGVSEDEGCVDLLSYMAPQELPQPWLVLRTCTGW